MLEIDIKRYLKKHKVSLLSEMGLSGWDINFNVLKSPHMSEELTEAGNMALVKSVRYEYHIATIELFADSIDNKQELIKTLKHELYHIILSPYEMFYDTLKDVLKDEHVRDSIHDYWIKCCELAVLGLEKVKK